MYSTLCRNILSDIKEHRAVADKGGISYRELLALVFAQHFRYVNLITPRRKSKRVD